jgi:hypothetical protein
VPSFATKNSQQTQYTDPEHFVGMLCASHCGVEGWLCGADTNMEFQTPIEERLIAPGLACKKLRSKFVEDQKEMTQSILQIAMPPFHKFH